jgi:hypothetical protein
MRRDIALSTAFVGRGAPVAGPVTPFVPDGATEPISLVSLLTGDWSGGTAAGHVKVLDLELLRITLEQAYARVGPVEQRLRSDDSQAVRVRRDAQHWLARYPVTRPVRIGAARAVILQRP